MNATEFEQSYNIGYMAGRLMDWVKTLNTFKRQSKELERLGGTEKELVELYHAINRSVMRGEDYHPYLMEMAMKLYRNSPEYEIGRENLRKAAKMEEVI